MLSLKEYQIFAQPVFWEQKDFFVSTSTCEALRTINLSINLVVLAILIFHYHFLYKNVLYEGIEYQFDKKSPYSFFSSIYFTKLMFELVIFAIIIPPNFLYNQPLNIITWGQGYGKNDLRYSLNTFIFIWFIVARILLIGRIVTRYSKFRTFRSE